MRGGNLLRALLIVLVAVAPTACHADDEDTRAVSSSAQLSEPPGATPAAPDPAPAAPDPAPAAPDPAPAPPPPAPRQDETFPLPGALAAEEPVTPIAAACADVLEALTDAVIRYEMAALAERSGSGSRSRAAAEMLALIEDARAAAGSQAGVPSAAAPAIDAVIALRGGLDSRPTLDEDDAAPWRGPRDDLQAWCSARG